MENWNLAFFKNVPFARRRSLQLRWEIFNVLNHTQFNAIDTTARFDPAGNQINSRFGLATSARNPRIRQGSVRLNF